MPSDRSSLHYTSLSTREVFKQFQTSDRGIASKRALQLLETYGKNESPAPQPDSMLLVFARQFASPLVLLLAVSALSMIATGHGVDAMVIVVVVMLNATLGAVQEGRAQNVLSSLLKFTKTQATVMRDDQEHVIDSSEIVPGDVVVLREGEKVPADIRLIDSRELAANESALTGESVPRQKNAQASIHSIGNPSDATTMVFKGTLITRGIATGVVVATGVNTFIGSIQSSVAQVSSDLPLQEKISSLSRSIAIGVVVFSALFLLLLVARGSSFSEAFPIVIALAVSIIPEGLPVTLTIILAIGVWRMSKRHALVKKLHAVEGLGQASVIAVDKTGTLTRNELMVTEIHLPKSTYGVTGKGFEPTGSVELTVGSQQLDELEHVAFCSFIANSSHIQFEEKAGVYTVKGDPTEAALAIFARKAQSEHTLSAAKVLDQQPFSYEAKYSVALWEYKGSRYLSIVGSPESVASHCDEHALDAFTSDLENASTKGLRAIAVASIRTHETAIPAGLPKLTLQAVCTMQDVVHSEAHDAVQRAHAAGLRVIMITGDYPRTALTIAKSVSIASQSDTQDVVLTGDQLHSLSPTQLKDRIKQVKVFARTTPQDKLTIVSLLKECGETVAMTGDGVNDAASLVAADLGIAMGQRGTEVAKEAADIILLEDNFKTITAAIEEGRSIYTTIKNVMLYLFTTATGEALTLVVAVLFGLPSPLLAVQIIWLNLVTDGFINIGLSFEKHGKRLLNPTWAKRNVHLIDRTMVVRMLLVGTTMAAGTLFVFTQFLPLGIPKAMTIALTTLATLQWCNALNCRSGVRSLVDQNLIANKPLLLSIAVVVALQVAAVHFTPLSRILGLVPLSLMEWVLCIGMGSTVILVEELRKALRVRA